VKEGDHATKAKMGKLPTPTRLQVFFILVSAMRASGLAFAGKIHMRGSFMSIAGGWIRSRLEFPSIDLAIRLPDLTVQVTTCIWSMKNTSDVVASGAMRKSPGDGLKACFPYRKKDDGLPKSRRSLKST